MKTVLKSQTARFKDFRAEVQAHVAEMGTWLAHMARVADDEKNQPDPLKRHRPYPAPHAPALVQECVNEAGNPDYEVVNDDPAPDQVLAAKKRALSDRIIAAHTEAAARILPAGKRLLLGLRANDVAAADNARLAAVREANPAARPTAEDARKARSAEETEFMAKHDALKARLAAAHRAMAQMLSDVEDLTLDDIDGWKIPAFPT